MSKLRWCIADLLCPARIGSFGQLGKWWKERDFALSERDWRNPQANLPRLQVNCGLAHPLFCRSDQGFSGFLRINDQRCWCATWRFGIRHGGNGDFGRPREVSVEQLYRLRRIPRHYGIHDRLVFSNDIARVAVLSSRKVPQAVGQIEQGFVKLVGASGKGTLRLGPRGSDGEKLPLAARPGNMLMTAPKPVAGYDDLLFPGRVAMRDCLSYGDLADPAARSREFLHVVGSRNGDAKSALLDLFDQMQSRISRLSASRNGLAPT